jgi:hypothetical protein
MLILAGLTVAAYHWPTWWVQGPALGVAVYTLVDLLLVATAHVFGLTGLPRYPLRFVVLNLLGFLTLVFWFAIFFAPLASRFNPPLTASRAIALAFVATTASSVVKAPEPTHWSSAVLAGAATIVALYFVIVILAVALNTIENTKRKAFRGR